MQSRSRFSFFVFSVGTLLWFLHSWQGLPLFQKELTIEGPSAIGFKEPVRFSVKSEKQGTAKLLANDSSVLSVPLNVSLRDGYNEIVLDIPQTFLVPGNYEVAVDIDGAKESRHAFSWALKNDGIDPEFFNLPPTAREVIDRRTSGSVTFNIEQNKYADVTYPFVKKDGLFFPAEFFGRQKGNEYRFDLLPDDTSVMFDVNQPQYTLSQLGHSLTVQFNAKGQGRVESPNSIVYQLSENVLLRWKVVGGQVVKEIVVSKEGQLPDLSFTMRGDEELMPALKDDMVTFTNASSAVVFASQKPYLIGADGVRLGRKVSLRVVDKDTYVFEFDTTNLSYPYVIDPTLRFVRLSPLVEIDKLMVRTLDSAL